MATAKKKSTAAKSGAKKGPAAKKSTGAKSGGAKSGGAKSGEAKKPRKVSSRRELIDTGTDKRYVRRSKDGTFKESDDVGRSLSADRKRKAKTKAKKGQGDRGD